MSIPTKQRRQYEIVSSLSITIAAIAIDNRRSVPLRSEALTRCQLAAEPLGLRSSPIPAVTMAMASSAAPAQVT